MKVSDELKNFLHTYKEILSLPNPDLSRLYTLLSPVNIGDFTKLLYLADFDPLKDLNYIPAYFMYSSKIPDFVIPDHIQIINGFAFAWCTELVSITIPKSVKVIEPSAFLGCPKLNDIYYMGTSEDREQMDIDDRNGKLLKARWHYMG